MSYEPDILRLANERLRQRREQNTTEYARRRAQVYERLPRVRAIDRQLRQTVTRAAAAALRKGVSPAPAIAALQEQSLALQAERTQLLRSIGCGADYLTEQPTCPSCKDSGWIGSQMCPCLKQLCSEEQAKKLSSLLDLRGQSFETFRLDYYGPEYSRDRQAMNSVLTVCRRYAMQFPVPGLPNLFLTGKPGLGKTFLSACIAREVTQKGYSVVYDTAIHIFSEFEAARFSRSAEAEQSTKRYLNCDLLILDDLGTELNTPFTQSCLYNLINSRLVSGKQTVISSNLSISDIQRLYNAQTASRLAGEYYILNFTGQDIRQLKNNL